MTGYVKPDSTGDISAVDSLNVALGKLEKALDGKQAAGSYAPGIHDHNTLYYTKQEISNILMHQVVKVKMSIYIMRYFI